MYCPYFRGKQFELILLRDNAKFLAENKIHPIIEPVKSDFKAMVRAMKVINENNVNCTLIVNPQVGQEPVSELSILGELIEGDLKEHTNLSLGYMMHPQSSISALVSHLKKYRDFAFTIIHCGYTNGKEIAIAIKLFENVKMHTFIEGFAGKLYQRHFKNNSTKRILIRNGFKSQKKNANYPPDEHFSDLHITYSDEGMDGFGDYSIAGDEYTESGGPAYAVAIHLTYLGAEDDMFINHFISDQTNSPTDPGGKFLEALAKLAKEISKPKSKIFKSDACKEYLDLYHKKHYPGLGYVKKLSMQHHIELVAEFLRNV